MTRKQLIERIQMLGEIRERRSGLEATERELSEEVRKGLAATKTGELSSAEFTACLAGKTKWVIDPAKLRKLLDKKQFMEAIRVDVKTARRFVADADLPKVGVHQKTATLRVSRLAVASASAKTPAKKKKRRGRS